MRPFSPDSSSLYGTIQSRSSKVARIHASLPLNTLPSPCEDRPSFPYSDGEYGHSPYHPPPLSSVDTLRRPISLGVASRTLLNEPTYSCPRSDALRPLASGQNSAKSSTSRISSSATDFSDNRTSREYVCVEFAVEVAETEAPFDSQVNCVVEKIFRFVSVHFCSFLLGLSIIRAILEILALPCMTPFANDLNSVKYEQLWYVQWFTKGA